MGRAQNARPLILAQADDDASLGAIVIAQEKLADTRGKAPAFGGRDRFHPRQAPRRNTAVQIRLV
ncbi:MAG: hypothetical protein ABI992_08510 [Chthoniobacterales bacterium]